MKMPKPLYDELYSKIVKLNINLQGFRDHLRTLEKPSKDIEKRLRWDMMYYAVGSRWVCEHIYDAGMDDTHIDTALKKIVKELESHVRRL